MKTLLPALSAGSKSLVPAALLLVVALAANGAEPARDEPNPAWRNGPVRSIITSDEDKAYKALKTDEDRRKAIEQFWARRDPTPGTPANEYKDDFYKRVDEANREFRESTSPGWATDRGRVLLIAGYPKERKPGDEQETWSYANLLADPSPLFSALDEALAKAGMEKGGNAAASRTELKQELSSVVKVDFAKNESGDYTLSEGGALLNALRKLEPRDQAVFTLPREGALAALKGAVAPKAAGPKAAAPQAGGGEAAKPAAGAPGAGTPGRGTGAAEAPAALPEGVDRLKQAALAPEAKNQIGMVTVVRYFKSEDGSTRTVVMIALKRSDLTLGPDGKPQAILYARLLPEGVADAAPVEFLEQNLFTPHDDPGEGWVKYAFAWPLKRKNYELRVGASDGPEGKIATRVESLVLPDFKGDTLALSSVTLARSTSPAAGEAGEDRFRVGALRMVPWVKPVLGPKDDLSFFYDLYNARRDPSTNRPSLDIEYVFEKKESSGWKRRGHLTDADKHEETLGYTIPSETLSQWPAGEYRLTVRVKDKIASTDGVSSVEFSIAR